MCVSVCDILKIPIALKIHSGCTLPEVFELARAGSLVKLLYNLYFSCPVWEDAGTPGRGLVPTKRVHKCMTGARPPMVYNHQDYHQKGKMACHFLLAKPF